MRVRLRAWINVINLVVENKWNELTLIDKNMSIVSNTVAGSFRFGGISKGSGAGSGLQKFKANQGNKRYFFSHFLGRDIGWGHDKPVAKGAKSWRPLEKFSPLENKILTTASMHFTISPSSNIIKLLKLISPPSEPCSPADLHHGCLCCHI